MANILLAGFGQLARQIFPILKSQGHQVTGLCRTPDSSMSIPLLNLDLTEKNATAKLSCDYDIVLITLTPGERSANAYKKTYLDAVSNLVEHFSKYQSKARFIFVSSTRVYGQSNGERISEISLTSPMDEQGLLLLKTEQKILENISSSVIVRFSGIYGGQRQYFFNKIKQGIKVQQTPPYFTNRIHQDDCVGILVFLISKMLANEFLESIYLCSDDAPHPMHQVAAWIAEEHGFPKPNVKPMDENAVQNKRCDNTRIKQLGYEFKYPSYKEGYSKITVDAQSSSESSSG